MNKKIIALGVVFIVLLIVLLIILANRNSGSGTQITPIPTQNSSQINLIWWNLFEPEANVRPLTDAFESEYPNIKIQYTQMGLEGVDDYKTELEKMKAVTREDILRVYEKYIQDKPYLATSFVPKGQLNLVAEGSVNAGVKEEDISNATQVAIEQMAEEPIKQTPSSFDRNIMPADGPDPMLSLPAGNPPGRRAASQAPPRASPLRCGWQPGAFGRYAPGDSGRCDH